MQLFPLRPPATAEERDQRIMEFALREAQRAWEADEVPVGAVVVRGNELLGRGANTVEALRDATAHAEMIALTPGLRRNRRQAPAASGALLHPGALHSVHRRHAPRPTEARGLRRRRPEIRGYRVPGASARAARAESPD